MSEDHDFDRCLHDWQLAEELASAAELRLRQLLDCYCEGQGPAPPLRVVHSCQELRHEAALALGTLVALTREHRARLKEL